ncbi:MAG: response regulator [Balneolales bacterium]
MPNQVLCVEDDFISQMLMKQILKKTSFANNIHVTSNGSEALNYYETLYKTGDFSNYPRLVLLDLNMPVINGWEFLDEFTDSYWPHFKDTKVAILTSSIDNEDKKRAAKYPIITDFLVKPLTLEMIERLKLKVTEL